MRILISISLFLFIAIGCKNAKYNFISFSGNTMGTSYNVQVDLKNVEKTQRKVDELLLLVNEAASTYIDTSLVSLFNTNYQQYITKNQSRKDLSTYLNENYILAAKVYEESEGVYDPSVMPLVNYWGFGYTPDKILEIDSLKIDSLRSIVGMDQFKFNGDIISKARPEAELDFSSIAKGYAVDRIAELLISEGAKNFYVEIGGEVFAQGKNAKGNIWRTGISVPSPKAGITDYQRIVEVVNNGIATSGNYRNFYVADEQIISHTINPKTGYPERNELLSATIIGPNCATADAYATACMVMGLEKCKTLIDSKLELEAILIYDDGSEKFATIDTREK